MEAKRHYYVTPTSYLQLLDCFKTLLRRQQQGVTAQRRRYEIGLEKLAGTEEQVRMAPRRKQRTVHARAYTWRCTHLAKVSKSTSW